ncbi:hypothetical protein HERIO_578 [Hepatospora eriocheir]|uniref:Uncharacterized protein n=1 Tax=Hepatospora eriocheir TaxID=1081669 RepID=A0A1X0QCQ7_9MICR|nr:hypothetical protein HERIO_578 [Hepatospora eriocheir]
MIKKERQSILSKCLEYVFCCGKSTKREDTVPPIVENDINPKKTDHNEQKKVHQCLSYSITFQIIFSIIYILQWLVFLWI